MWLVVASYTQYVSLVGMEGMARLKMVLDERLINFEWKKVPHLIHKFQFIVWNMILSNRIEWLFDTSISTRNLSISWIFSMEIVPMNRNFWVCYFLLGVVGHGKPCQNLARSVRGASGWYELFRQVKIVQNESLVN